MLSIGIYEADFKFQRLVTGHGTSMSAAGHPARRDSSLQMPLDRSSVDGLRDKGFPNVAVDRAQGCHTPRVNRLDVDLRVSRVERGGVLATSGARAE